MFIFYKKLKNILCVLSDIWSCLLLFHNSRSLCIHSLIPRGTPNSALRNPS